MKYSYYQNKKQPPCAEVTDEEVANLIRHDEKLAHMTLDIRQHITANDIATADSIKGELPSVTFSARFTGGRRYDKLTEYNGEIVLDLDKKSPEEPARISGRKSPKIRTSPHQLLPARRATSVPFFEGDSLIVFLTTVPSSPQNHGTLFTFTCAAGFITEQRLLMSPFQNIHK